MGHLESNHDLRRRAKVAQPELKKLGGGVYQPGADQGKVAVSLELRVQRISSNLRLEIGTISTVASAYNLLWRIYTT